METITCIYIMPQKIEKQRRQHMTVAAKKHGINIVDTYNEGVTHIISECETREQALGMLKSKITPEVQILNSKWFVESMKAKRPIPATEDHILKNKSQENMEDGSKMDTVDPGIASWSCLRSTPLVHHNHKYCDALETLQKYAELKDGDNDYSRALAFRRASCVLKTLPGPLKSIRQLSGVKDIGKHVTKVLQEILEEGFSEEVEKIKEEDWFQKMLLFESIFGVGSSTGKKWIEMGISSIEDARTKVQTNDWRVKYGLAFYEELNDPVIRNEADNLQHYIENEARQILPGVMIELTGGFRRGKPAGHDIDLLITHPVEGKEVGFLQKLLSTLEEKGIILYGKWEKNSYREEILYTDFKLSQRGQLDHFEKWIGIIKIPKSWKSVIVTTSNSEEGQHDVSQSSNSVDEYEPNSKRRKLCCGDLSPFDLVKEDRDWIARRVDLIISPYSQYYYALVGWTGSKHFNRDLRLYGTRTYSRKLSSHGLWDHKKGGFVPASSEKEVFENMEVPYFPPEERNC